MPQIYLKTIEGQKILFNNTSNVVIIELREVFHHAGEKLNWNEKYGKLGFGINLGIVDFVIKRKCVLLVRHKGFENIEYWIRYDTLKEFKKNNNFLTKIYDTYLYNIPIKLFSTKPSFLGMLNDI